jgi:hypothetical protein
MRQIEVFDEGKAVPLRGSKFPLQAGSADSVSEKSNEGKLATFENYRRSFPRLGFLRVGR